MAFRDLPETPPGVELLQRSLQRGRLAHAYLFTGRRLEELETLARTLAKTLNCEHPVRKDGAAPDCCDRCPTCRRIDHDQHPDVHWVRPESKTRVVRIEQMRGLMREIYLKPTDAELKVCVVVAADRLNDNAANAFLKTLEEPPARSLLVLLTTEPQRMLETILSRCLRLNFGLGPQRPVEPAQIEWLRRFSDLAAAEQKSLLGRYRLMDGLVLKLGELKSRIEETLTARSPLQQYKDVEKELSDRWEDELAAAIEAEYRRQRGEWLGVLHWWLRDVWLEALASESAGQSPDGAAPRPSRALASQLLSFPGLAGTKTVASRITAKQGLENLQILEQLQRWLGGNVQEALALEVSLLKLRL